MSSLSRQDIEEQERNAAHPVLLRIANIAVLLGGGLLIFAFIGSFVMFMNAREDIQQESVGTYHASSF